ncbi:Hypothetical predicted protein, partial [Paramuricea clavata]
MSETEMKRHMSVLHHDKKGKGSGPVQKEHQCNFIIKSGGNSRRCGLAFPSKNKLAAHKQQTSHLQRKRKIGNSSKAGASEPKQLRLEETLMILENASVPERNPADHDQQEEEACNLCHQEDVDENKEDIDVDDW